MNEESEFTALTKYFYFAPIYMSFLFFTQVTFFFVEAKNIPLN